MQRVIQARKVEIYKATRKRGFKAVRKRKKFKPHGARPARCSISGIKWIRTGRLTEKNSIYDAGASPLRNPSVRREDIAASPRMLSTW